MARRERVRSDSINLTRRDVSMFTNKKIHAALLCTPLFGACVVNGDDTAGDSGGSETSNTTSATAMSATDMSAGSESSSAGTSISTSADSGSSTEPGTESGGTTDTDGTTGGAGMACFQMCAEAADCVDPNLCPDGAGDYPCNYTCEADGTCSSPGCTSNDDCSFGGMVEGFVCVDFDGYGLCSQSCEMDMDCTATQGPDATCSGDDGNGGTVCELPAPPPCMTDDDCDFGLCDVDSGACGSCGTSDDCPKGFTCAGV